MGLQPNQAIICWGDSWKNPLTSILEICIVHNELESDISSIIILVWMMPMSNWYDWDKVLNTIKLFSKINRQTTVFNNKMRIMRNSIQRKRAYVLCIFHQMPFMNSIMRILNLYTASGLIKWRINWIHLYCRHHGTFSGFSWLYEHCRSFDYFTVEDLHRRPWDYRWPKCCFSETIEP